MIIHLLTCRELPTLNDDDQVLRDRLEDRGHLVEVGPWDGVPPSKAATTLVRSCWDYHERPDDFLAALNGMTAVLNETDVIRWNADKKYLKHYRDNKVPIIPTHFEGDTTPDWNCDEFIVKPRVSNAANGVVRLPGMSLESVLEKRSTFSKTVLIQPFVKEIGEVGEYSMIYIGGQYSHCVHKLPGKGDFRVQHLYGGSYETVTPDTALAKAADNANAVSPRGTAYARFDFIPYQGQYCLSEAEMIEPWLHFQECPEAADRLVEFLEDY